MLLFDALSTSALNIGSLARFPPPNPFLPLYIVIVSPNLNMIRKETRPEGVGRLIPSSSF